jgi:hypothetical protein
MGIFDRSQQTSIAVSPPFFWSSCPPCITWVGKSNAVIGVIQIDLFVVLNKGRSLVNQHSSGLHELLLGSYFIPPKPRRSERTFKKEIGNDRSQETKDSSEQYSKYSGQ